MHLGDLMFEIISSLDLCYLSQIGIDRFCSGCLDRSLIHARRIKIADQSNIASGFSLLLCRFFENIVQHVPVALGKYIETSPSRLRRRDLGILYPSAVGKLKEIVAGVR